MDFIEYLEDHGVDTKNMEFKDSPEKMFNFIEAVNLALQDILKWNSDLYVDLLKDVEFDFKAAITIKDNEKSMDLKDLIKNYNTDTKGM